MERIKIILKSEQWHMASWKDEIIELSKRTGRDYNTTGHDPSLSHSGLYNIGDSFWDIDRFFSEVSVYGFLEILEQLIAVLRDFYLRDNYSVHEHRLSWLVEEITNSLGYSKMDLGIYFDKEEGIFYPSGAKLLDEVLVNENLQWLQQYPAVLSPFDKGLRFLLQGRNDPEKLQDTITDVYETLETFAKVVCENEKDLSGNAGEFIKRLGFSKNVHYRNMLKEYIAYANHYRHGKKEGESKPRPPLVYAEVEAFVYLTGLFIRLGIEKLKQPSPDGT